VCRRPGERDPLAAARGAGNVLVLTFADGAREVVRGRGAGAWPTACAVLADLYDLSRRHRRACERPAQLPAQRPALLPSTTSVDRVQSEVLR
jgi:hypothetical protein